MTRNRFVLDDSQVNDDAKNFTACPFCYVNVELCKLCDHVEGEHCFDVTNAVCFKLSVVLVTME